MNNIERLKMMRKKHNMTQKELAEKIGVTRQTIIAIEKGEYNPTLNICIDICKVFNKSLNYFFKDYFENK